MNAVEARELTKMYRPLQVKKFKNLLIDLLNHRIKQQAKMGYTAANVTIDCPLLIIDEVAEEVEKHFLENGFQVTKYVKAKLIHISVAWHENYE